MSPATCTQFHFVVQKIYISDSQVLQKFYDWHLDIDHVFVSTIARFKRVVAKQRGVCCSVREGLETDRGELHHGYGIKKANVQRTRMLLANLQRPNIGGTKYGE